MSLPSKVSPGFQITRVNTICQRAVYAAPANKHLRIVRHHQKLSGPGLCSNAFEIDILPKMDDNLKIQGAKIPALFDDLIATKTPLNLYLPPMDLNTTVHMDQCKNIQKHPFFRIHLDKIPPQLDIGDIGKMMMIFEYVAKNRALHRFVSRNAKCAPDGIWVAFPNVVEEVQQRESFRIKAPEGSIIFLNMSPPMALRIANISIGGALAEEMPLEDQAGAGSPLKVGTSIPDAEIRIPLSEKRVRITIDRFSIIRRQVKAGAKSAAYAISFDQMTASQENILVKVIYEIQRRFLQRRVKLK